MNHITIKFWTGTTYENVGQIQTRLTGPELAEYYRSKGLLVSIRAAILDSPGRVQAHLLVAPANKTVAAAPSCHIG